jgi:cell division protein FtsN
VKVGRKYSYDLTGITEEDKKKVVELLSQNEEELAEIKKNKDSHTVENSDIENKLQEKINNEFGTEGSVGHSSDAHAPNMSTEAGHKTDSMSGKFTIQLGSHRTLKEAEDFAEGFKARGYDPIINEIEIKGKGTWFRVSLGAFSNQEEAKSYIAKEKSLFIGQDYTIIKMP